MVYKHKDNGNYYYRFQIRGRRYHGVIDGAQDIEQAKKGEVVEKGKVYNQTYGADPSNVSLGEFITTVYLPWSKQEKRSYKDDASRSKALIAAFGKRRMRDITQIAIGVFRRERLNSMSARKRKRAPASVDRELQLLSQVYNKAIAHGLLKDNPCKGVPRCDKGSTVTRYLTDDEQARLIAVLKGRRAHAADALLLSIYTGMRKGEVLSLHVSQVDFSRDRVILTKTKNGKPHAVPIENHYRSILQRLCQTAINGHLFFNKRTGRPMKDIKTAWARALREAGIDHIPFHCAGRHSFGTRAAANGASLADIQAVMGHADIRTTMRYITATEQGQRRAIKAAAQSA